MTDATPPLRIVSAYSVNGVNFEIGYSMLSELLSNGFVERGVTKNKRPRGVCATWSIVRTNHDYG